MKYLLTCAACGTEMPVTTGQAGQILRCHCGQTVEVPSVRNLKHLPPAVDEPVSPVWTKQKGFLFLGATIAACSLAFGIAILVFRPSAADASPPIAIDPAAIQHEVDALSLPESFARLAATVPGAQRAADQIQNSYTPLSKQQLQDFEREAFLGPSAKPLALAQLHDVFQKATERYTRLTDNRKVLANLNHWLIFAGAAMAVGILIACAAVIAPTTSPPRVRP
jgi:hypothetical protein